ncbi:hypothetical protein RD792_011965 [Penstemon davidsonii]|uniref:TSL-kinase interacting protein 1 n=1 Tax=Penstemon davidsonii TaxID=160366 RepID=A0ABR0CWG4_9LAMI|nr:hypothetical protein RD792_011965 [Penstemon davidsonii]
MQMVSQVSLDRDVYLSSDNIGNKDGVSSVPTSLQDCDAPQMPVKKQTRQWAAWTRQEEESFFAALRQNFEKITCRVQSKNKDQVRHYYYRLVRRMNKLLGPELSLDAKNSKETIAAMLRWVLFVSNYRISKQVCYGCRWSLLEKYSCKASKLHLKPRRFKIFMETLENQLLKDRKKNIRKRRSTEENNSHVAHIIGPTQGKVSGHDNRAVKMVLVDSQNIQKVGTGKGSLLKRNVNIGINRTNCKVDPTFAKKAKHRGKTGLVSTSAYKRWEKAAIAGVSLVADAAEHLERADTDKEIEHALETPGHDGSHDVAKLVNPLPEPLQSTLNENNIQTSTKLKLQLLPIDECTRKASEMIRGSQDVAEVVHSFPASLQSTLNENNIQTSTKLKLQLFPIDECTQKSLELWFRLDRSCANEDNHNPHLELTLSTRKKISSVVEHLNRKWGNSSLLSEDLMLFPYWAQRENLLGYQKWNKDSTLCAADVYYLIGSPPVFRLRYGWFSKAEFESATAQALSCANHNEQNVDMNIEKVQNAETEKPSGPLAEQMTTLTSSSTCLRINKIDSGGSAVVSSHRRETGALAVTKQVENMKDMALSAGDWADSLTSISVGDLLSESAQNMDVNCTEFPVPVRSNCLQQTPFSCDSFDAAIAAHFYKHQNKLDFQQDLVSHGPSIWDAEETCDAFSFQKNRGFSNKCNNASKNDSPDACELTSKASPSASHKEIEELTEMEKLTNANPTCGVPMDDCKSVHMSENLTKDFGGLTDVYWSDSLGPLDLDIPSCRYHSDDLILSDSLGGLNRVLATSMDAFQNCSFFGLDKKEAASTVEPCQIGSFSDFKISSEV